MTIPPELLRELKNGDVWLFVGSGVSNAAGLDSWHQLSEAMVAAIKATTDTYTDSDFEHYLKHENPHPGIALIFKGVMEEEEYYRFLRDRYRRNVPLSSLHNALANLPVKVVITTNYDKLLENAFRRPDCYDPPVVIYPKQIGYVRDEPRIVKLHGDIDHPETIVLTAKDYDTYKDTHEALNKWAEDAINSHTILFVGFGLKDENFLQMYKEARNAPMMKKRAFAIMTNTDPIEREVWRERLLTIIPVDNHNAITLCVEEIRARLATP